MKAPSRQRGWDKQTVNQIARDEYGGLDEMFEAHGWAKPSDRTRGQIAPTMVVQTYGSVENFERAHQDGINGNPFVNPLATIEGSYPDVWLTSFYGFAPRNWGFLGFTDERMRMRFVRESRPGALVVVYAASKAAPDERGKVIGIQQMGARLGDASEFMPPEAWAEKQANPDRRDKWNLAVQAVRAWRVTPETRMRVEEFAPETYRPDRSQFIGAWGMKLSADDARNILKLDLVEVEVFGGLAAFDGLPGDARSRLKPSRPGPVSQNGHWSKEAEGPKHLYILHLAGDADALLGYPANGSRIVKVGFSHSPDTRCDAHNGALPACAFKWKVDFSTFLDGRKPFPSSGHAKAGEQAMKDLLEKDGQSLGGEFFLANKIAVDRAWKAAIEAAENWKP